MTLDQKQKITTNQNIQHLTTKNDIYWVQFKIALLVVVVKAESPTNPVWLGELHGVVQNVKQKAKIWNLVYKLSLWLARNLYDMVNI